MNTITQGYLNYHGKFLQIIIFELIVAFRYASGGAIKQPIIYIYNGTNITFTGGGTIDGNGPYWYPCEFNTTNPPCHPYGR